MENVSRFGSEPAWTRPRPTAADGLGLQQRREADHAVAQLLFRLGASRMTTLLRCDTQATATF